MTIKLNNNERDVFRALCDAAQAATAGDFGFTDEVDYKALGLTGKQYAGYVSSLVNKGLVEVDNPVVNDRIVNGQFTFPGDDDVREAMRLCGVDPQTFDSTYQFVLHVKGAHGTMCGDAPEEITVPWFTVEPVMEALGFEYEDSSKAVMVGDYHAAQKVLTLEVDGALQVFVLTRK